MTSSKSMLFVISCSIDNIAELVNLFCDMVDRKYVLVSFNLLKERSPEATVTGMVRNNLYAVIKFGQVESSSYFLIAFKIFKAVAFKSGKIAFT